MSRLTVDDGFKLAAVGDLLVSRPFAALVERDPGLAGALGPLRQADAAFGNLETPIVDPRGADIVPYGDGDDWTGSAPANVAGDLVRLGFDFFGRANNHALDRGPGGLLETTRRLDEVGLVHAGVGARLGEARAPRYLETPGGRVALVSATTSPMPRVAAAVDPFGPLQGRAGVNALRLKRKVTVPPERYVAFEWLADSLPEVALPWAPLPPGSVELFGTQFSRGDEFAVEYSCDPDDWNETLRSIRSAADQADLVVAALHGHQNDPAPHDPPAIFRAFARAAIAAGADAVMISGTHELAPIEIVDGRPVFYGLGNFVWTDHTEGLERYFYELSRDLIKDRFPDPSMITDRELIESLMGDWDASRFFRALVAEVSFASGKLDEVRLHPVDLGYDKPLARRGLPRRGDDAFATDVLQHVRSLSEPFGTEITIEGAIGIVTVPSA